MLVTKVRLLDEAFGKQAKLVNLTLKVPPGGGNHGLYKVQTLELGVRLPKLQASLVTKVRLSDEASGKPSDQHSWCLG